MHLKLGSPRKRRMSKSKSLATLTDSKIEQNGKVPYTSYTSLRNLLNIENEGRKEQENYRTRRCYTCSSSTLLSRHGKENPAKTTQSLRKQSISSPCLQLLNNICTPSLLRKALENSISEDLQYQADFDDSCSSQCSSDGSKGSFEDFGVYQISTRNGIQRGSFNLPIRKTSSCVDISFPFGVGKLRKISNAFSKSEKTLNRSERTLNRSERTLNRSVRRRVSKRRRRYCSESQKSSDSGISKSESGRDVFSVYDNVDTKIADDDGDDATQEDDVFTEEPRHYLKIEKLRAISDPVPSAGLQNSIGARTKRYTSTPNYALTPIPWSKRIRNPFWKRKKSSKQEQVTATKPIITRCCDMLPSSSLTRLDKVTAV